MGAPAQGWASVEQPIAGDELRAIKRHLATRTDALPWLFISERGQPLTRQAVNYLIAVAAERAALPGGIRTRSGNLNIRVKSCHKGILKGRGFGKSGSGISSMSRPYFPKRRMCVRM